MADEYTVLVVDDDEIIRELIMEYLSRHGITIHAAANGREALEYFFSVSIAKPDLVLLDILMPEIGGFEVCSRLRDKYSASELPVIMLTGLNSNEDLIKGFNAGANDYLTKPFVGEELLARVLSHLEIKKAYETLEENNRLKDELRRRRKTEQYLRITHQRLSRILDAVEDAVLAVNECEEICFCNRSCEKMLGFIAYDLLGKSIWTLFPPEDLEGLLVSCFDMTNSHSGSEKELPKSYSRMVRMGVESQEGSVQVKAIPLEHEDELLIVLILQESGKYSSTGNQVPDILPAGAIIEELNHNRKRLHLLEENLNRLPPTIMKSDPCLLNGLRKVDTALEQLSSLLSDYGRPDMQRFIAEVMTLALNYWEQCTGSTKVDLARESDLWTIYTNQDGWDRTQTLDKYLHSTTVPRRPRLKKVIRTADFVLTVCTNPSPLRNRLESSLKSLLTIF